MKQHGARGAALIVLAGFCLLFTGCGANLRYRISPRNEYAYKRTVTVGEIDPKGKPKYLSTPLSQRILVKPYLQRGTHAGWFRVTTPTDTGGPTVYGDKNLGQKDILLDTKGKISEFKGDNRTFFFMDLFFHLPQHRIKRGGSWTSVQNVELNRTISVPDSRQQQGSAQYMTLPFDEILNIRYTYAGAASCGMRRCARIRVSANYTDTKEAVKDVASARLEYNRKGDILFMLKQGRVYSAVYEDTIAFQAINEIENIVQFQITHAQKIEYKLEK